LVRGRWGWFISQELVELALHRWDVDQAPLNDDTAEWLLPAVVRWNLGILYQGSDGAVIRVHTWTRSLPANEPSTAEPELTLAGAAASLCLFFYGRSKELRGLSATGNEALLQRFAGT
jgi:hypothetical protein